MLRNVTSDHFNQRDGNKTDEYYKIVNDIIIALSDVRPDTVSKIIQLLNDIKSSRNGMLTGSMQSGKMPAAMICIFIAVRYWLLAPIYFTKNLGVARADAAQKFKTGLINDIAIKVCEKHGYDKIVALRDFGIHSYVYDDTKSARIDVRRPGYVPILLYNNNNFKLAIDIYNKHNSLTRPTPIFVIFDEYHELYTDTKAFIREGGLKKHGTKTIKNREILHWFTRKALQNKCFIVGITATPQACMTSDPVCYPRAIRQIGCDPPAQGLVRFGFDMYGNMQNINFCHWGTTTEDLITTINTIIRRPRKNIDGKIEVPLILVTVEHFNTNQQDLREEIEEELQKHIVCANILVLNQSSITLETWYNMPNFLARDICERGALIIISKCAVGAAVTIKPCIDAIYDGITYTTMHGITDQIVRPKNFSVVTESQIIRISGWDHPEHTANLWVPDESYTEAYRELGAINDYFTKNYDPVIGPASVQNITVKSKRIDEIYSNSPYTKTSHGCRIVHRTDNTTDQIVLRTDIVYPTAEQIHSLGDLCERPLSSFFAKIKDQNRLKRCFNIESNGNLAQVPYDEDRQKALFKAVFIPEGQFKVNTLIWGPDGLQTLAKNLYMIRFDPWDQRPQGKKDHEVNLCFRTANEWIFMEQCKQFNHDALEAFQSMAMPTEDRSDGFSNEHHQVLDDIDAIWEQVKHEKITCNAFNLYMKASKDLYGSARREQWLPRFKEALETNLKEIIDTAVDLDQALSGAKDLLREGSDDSSIPMPVPAPNAEFRGEFQITKELIEKYINDKNKQDKAIDLRKCVGTFYKPNADNFQNLTPRPSGIHSSTFIALCKYCLKVNDSP